MTVINLAALAITDTPVVAVISGLNYGSRSSSNPIVAIIQNTGANNAYIGGVTVTSANGIKLLPGESMPLEIAGADVYYAICATAESATIRVMVTRA